MKDEGMRLRLEKELREQFVSTCRLQGIKAAEVLRAFMQDYVLREGEGRQASLFERPVAAKPRVSRRRKKK